MPRDINEIIEEHEKWGQENQGSVKMKKWVVMDPAGTDLKAFDTEIEALKYLDDIQPNSVMHAINNIGYHVRWAEVEEGNYEDIRTDG